MSFDPHATAEKYNLAVENDSEAHPDGGTTGLELEWNLYAADFSPAEKVEGVDFIDYLRAEVMPDWLLDFNKLEVFGWMTEWITRPYYSARHTVYEGWLLEGALLNALAASGQGRMYAYHGNLLHPADVSHADIPGSWNIAKRRYLERCVDLYGVTLATAGTHVNASLPESLLSWDFMHLPASERGEDHLDGYKNRVYIDAARLLRAFAALSIAVTASTPLRVDRENGHSHVVLTDVDSNRNLTFPNDRNLDVPHLYRSYQDYVRISYDLVQRGVRFGNNNWTPVRARSSAEPVERIISVTADQLQSLYSKGIYGQSQNPEDLAREIEQANLRARIDLPMSRVELRTDEGGHDLDLDVAHLALIQLLLLRIYADPVFARAFRYDVEDIARARRNESAAAMHGLRAEIEDPFTGKPVEMRDFLGWTLAQVGPLADGLGWSAALEPLHDLQHGAPNAAEQIRARVRERIGGQTDVVPPDVLAELAEEREALVQQRVGWIAAAISGEGESARLADLAERACDTARGLAAPCIDFCPSEPPVLEVSYPDKTSEIVDLASRLVRIPSVTNCPEERLDEVARAGQFIRRYLDDADVCVEYFDQGRYPALLASFSDKLAAPVMLSGHFDVVKPEPDDSQFDARLDGDWLWGRGAADMKTVVATYLVWMKDQARQPGPKPGINLMLVGNEENGEFEPTGTPHALQWLLEQHNYAPELFIAGERTGESGTELMGKVCVENRGVARYRVIARGQAGHTGVTSVQAGLVDRLLSAQQAIAALLPDYLTLEASDGWRSTARFPFINVGEPGVYNITASLGEMGIEVRSIPQDDLSALCAAIQTACDAAGLELLVEVQEGGIACDPDNPHLAKLLAAVKEVNGGVVEVDKKLPGTSARFAPRGQGIVWGQSGLGPHARDERHYIPSIKPYYDALNALAERYR